MTSTFLSCCCCNSKRKSLRSRPLGPIRDWCLRDNAQYKTICFIKSQSIWGKKRTCRPSVDLFFLFFLLSTCQSAAAASNLQILASIARWWLAPPQIHSCLFFGLFTAHLANRAIDITQYLLYSQMQVCCCCCYQPLQQQVQQDDGEWVLPDRESLLNHRRTDSTGFSGFLQFILLSFSFSIFPVLFQFLPGACGPSSSSAAAHAMECCLLARYFVPAIGRLYYYYFRVVSCKVLSMPNNQCEPIEFLNTFSL